MRIVAFSGISSKRLLSSLYGNPLQGGINTVLNLLMASAQIFVPEGHFPMGAFHIQLTRNSCQKMTQDIPGSVTEC